MSSRFFLHVGLPRTATTSLQKEVFPRLKTIRYLGKPWDNVGLEGDISPLAELKQRLEQQPRDEQELFGYIGKLMPTILVSLKKANQKHEKKQAQLMAKVFVACAATIRKHYPDTALLYSDESLIESVAGLSSRPGHGAGVPLEILARTGFLDQATVCVVLRDPASFMRASYYKNMEFEQKFKGKPISFDKYVRRQLALYLRKPSASRIFLAMQTPFVAHLQRYCPNLVVNRYEKLIKAPHALDALLGVETGEDPVSLKDLPRENKSFRDDAAVRFVLTASGVPQGITIDEYAATFPATLDHYGLTGVFAENLLRPKRAAQKNPGDAPGLQ